MKTKILLLIILFQVQFAKIYAQQSLSSDVLYEKIESSLKKANIPGLTFIYVDTNKTVIKTWGYADTENKIPVNSQTLFELGSTSKSFTALAILKLEEEGLIDLNDNVSKYIPWFKVYFNDNEVSITIKQLMHHTSGFPMEAVSKIPIGEGDDMLEKTVQAVNRQELKTIPGEKYEYSTVNYDILGLVIEKISGLSYEQYMQQSIFKPMGMSSTSAGYPVKGQLAKGYKISFFSPREYEAPKFKGNTPAGYIISNAKDISKWLKYQLSTEPSKFEGIIKRSHIPDFSVAPPGLSSYASGWEVEPYGETKIYHTGMNPNYSSFIGFIPGKKTGIALLANSNSNYTAYLGDILLRYLNNEDISEIPEPENALDKIFSLVSIILSIFLIGILILFLWVIVGVVKQERKLNAFNLKAVLKILINLSLTLPFIYGIYILPKALMDFTWESSVVWAPTSYLIGCILFVVAVIGVWFLSILSIFIPAKNIYYRSLPMTIILSIMSGLANMVIILILINALQSEARIVYLLYYFALALVFYISSNKIVQTKLIRISLSIVYELRMKLINKIFKSSYQKFEKIDNGRVYATLNNDTATISNSVNVFIALISNIITIIGVFFYLGTVSLAATLIILAVIACVAVLYFIVSHRTDILFEQARDTANVFSDLVDGLLYGFKELSLSGIKKKEYTKEIESSCSELRDKSGMALIKFVNAFLIGETLLIMILGTVSFLIPVIFPEIPNYKLIGFIMIVLYLIGPINAVLNSIPTIMQIKVSWKRIQGFIDEVKPDLKLLPLIKGLKKEIKVENLSVKGLKFEYDNQDEDRHFAVGPINLNLCKGEILFIIGGNGSGKTTLANLLTGLYAAKEGTIEINGQQIQSNEIGELYSTVFSNTHIFQKLYGIEQEDKHKEIKEMLKVLNLEEKVHVDNNSFSTIELSNGQRKRLSLMKCILEDSQIFLFDEWAADQDPEYKKVFYHKLLPEMKKKGKIIIAITHDDNYFDVADKIIKMDMGKIVDFKEMELASL